MYVSETIVRVRYSETDQMGYVYYGHFAQYFEVGRVEAMRQLGVSYRELEEEGILMPVVDFQVRYLKPALYDDELTIKTTIKQLPTSRIFFEYNTYNAAGEHLNTASTTLFFMDKKTGKPRRAPEKLVQMLAQFFED